MPRTRRSILLILVLALVLPALTAEAGGSATFVATMGAAPVLLALGLVWRKGIADEAGLPVSRPVSDLPARMHRVLDALPDPAILIDRRGLVAAFNGRAAAVFPALRPDHPLSFALRDPLILDAVERVLSGRAETLSVEYGRKVPVDQSFEASVTVLSDTTPGAREAAAIVLRDVTQARRSEAMRVDFVANASHELRTPLASLLGFVETLQGPARNDGAARERFLAIMAEQARRMSRLIDDLLSLSRIELNAHLPPAGIIDLTPLVRHMADALSGLAEERGVSLSILCDETGPVEVAADRDEMLRVFENLIENAIKYGQAGKRVEITISRPPGRPEVAVSVTDHGRGIAPEHLPRLTERFYRVDVADSREKGGTGLGLAIVKHIITRHRGRLDVESSLGEGATFRVTLPLARHETVTLPS